MSIWLTRLGFALSILVLVTAALAFPAGLTLAFVGGPFLFWGYMLALVVCLAFVQARRERHDPRYQAFWKRLAQTKRAEVKD